MNKNERIDPIENMMRGHNLMMKLFAVVFFILAVSLLIISTYNYNNESSVSYSEICNEKGYNSYTPDSEQIVMGYRVIECCINKWDMGGHISACRLEAI